MRQHFKRVVSAVLATALVAQVGVVSAWAAPFKAQEVPAAAGMHPFTGTPDLIRSAAEELKAQGVTAQEKQQDEALVQRVETTADKSYDAVKSDLAQALVAQRGEGTVDVADLGLSMQDLAAVLHETLYEKYMNNAVTDVSYETTGGKVTGIRYNMSEGFAAAMDAVDADQLDDVDTEAEAEASVQQAASAVAVYANEEEEGGCRNHTVGGKSYKGDLNGDGKTVVTLNVYTLDYSAGDTQTESDAYLTMAGTTKLATDVAGGLSSVFLLYDPAGFQESTGSLRYLDGTLPEAGSDSDWWNMVYRWTDCPVLAGLDLGEYRADTTHAQGGDSQTYLADFYVGMRGAWNTGTEENLAGGEELWQALTAGAVSTVEAEG